jgi:hypothetical protein
LLRVVPILQLGQPHGYVILPVNRIHCGKRIPHYSTDEEHMATARAVNQGKSEFVEEQFRRDRNANHETIVEAWTSSGKEGTISPSLVQKIRAKLKLSGKRGRTKGAAPSKAKSTTNGRRTRRTAETATGSASETNGVSISSGASNGTKSARGGGREAALHEVEAGIDELIFTLMSNGGMPEVEEALRAARRLLVLSQGG